MHDIKSTNTLIVSGQFWNIWVLKYRVYFKLATLIYWIPGGISRFGFQVYYTSWGWGTQY